jgi:hypothetical protein
VEDVPIPYGLPGKEPEKIKDVVNVRVNLRDAPTPIYEMRSYEKAIEKPITIADLTKTAEQIGMINPDYKSPFKTLPLPIDPEVSIEEAAKILNQKVSDEIYSHLITQAHNETLEQFSNACLDQLEAGIDSATPYSDAALAGEAYRGKVVKHLANIHTIPEEAHPDSCPVNCRCQLGPVDVEDDKWDEVHRKINGYGKEKVEEQGSVEIDVLVDKDKFPHTCPIKECGAPAYVAGPGYSECSNPDCELK